MKLQKRTVYLPVKVEDELPDKNYGDILNTDIGIVGFENGVFGRWTTSGIWENPLCVKIWLKEQQAFVFNEEQLNELLSSVIKETLKVAAENAELDYWQGSCVLCGSNAVDEQSILNQFDNVFNKIKV